MGIFRRIESGERQGELWRATENREEGGATTADRQYQRRSFNSRVRPIFLRVPSRSVSLGEALKHPQTHSPWRVCVCVFFSLFQRSKVGTLGATVYFCSIIGRDMDENSLIFLLCVFPPRPPPAHPPAPSILPWNIPRWVSINLVFFPFHYTPFIFASSMSCQQSPAFDTAWHF